MAPSHKGSEWAWALKKVLKKALKRVNPLKKGLFRANPLFWVLKNRLKRVDLLKIVLKKALIRVGRSKECSREGVAQKSAQKSAHRSGSLKKGLKKVVTQKSAQNVLKQVGQSKKCSKEGVTFKNANDLYNFYSAHPSPSHLSSIFSLWTWFFGTQKVDLPAGSISLSYEESVSGPAQTGCWCLFLDYSQPSFHCVRHSTGHHLRPGSHQSIRCHLSDL